MKLKDTLSLLLSLSSVAGSVSAYAQVPEVERILVPVALKVPIQGAFGSEWHTELVVRNDSTEEARLGAGVDPLGLPFSIAIVPPRKTRVVPLFATGGRAGEADPVPAYVVVVYKPVVHQLSFQARVFDRSRSATDWGTEIPVIRESDAVRSRIQLLRIPTSPQFRLTLRVYGFDPRTDVLLRLFDEEEESLLGERLITLGDANPNSAGPQYWQTTDVAGTFGTSFTDREFVRIEVTRLNEQDRIWAFASVTHNETQHVTTITPQ
jgi:hypothetical protein